MVTGLVLAAALVTRVGEFARLEPEAAREAAPCCVTGVVTFVSSWRVDSFVIADPEDPNGMAIYVRGELYNESLVTRHGLGELRIGQILEVKGVTERLSFAPGIGASELKLVGERELPPAPTVRLRDLKWGVMDNRRVRIEGVLCEVSLESNDETSLPGAFTRVRVITPDGDFVSHIPGDHVEKCRPYIDGAFSIAGVAMTTFSLGGTFLGVQLQVTDLADVLLFSPPPEDPYALEETPLGELLPYSPQPPAGHRKRVRGVVTSYLPGEGLSIQSGGRTLLVESGLRLAVEPGDEIEAVGFAKMNANKTTLKEALFRPTGSHPGLPEPLALEVEHLDKMPTDGHGAYVELDARRVKLTARLLRLTADEGAHEAVVLFGRHLMSVTLPGPPPDEIRGDADLEPLLSMTGVLVLDYESDLPRGRVPAIRKARLVLSDADSLEIVPDAAYDARRRRRFFSRLTWAGIAALLVGIALLMIKLTRSRREAEKLEVVVAERKRMAGDLHDTIEQNLASARMLLRTSVLLSPGVPDRVKEALGTVAGILAQAKRELRETVFNLRSDEVFDQPPERVFRDFAKRLSAHGTLRVKTLLRGIPERLPGAVFSDLIFIMQEAVTNAVKHGRARTIMITSDPLPARLGPGFVLSVANDGEPFDPNAALGPEAGHFGLAGMRERASRNGIGFAWESSPGRMTLRLTIKL